MLFLVEMFSWILPILAVLVLLIVIAAGYVKAPPDQAYIISGLKKEARILIGRAGIRVPFFERLDRLYLGQMTVDIKTEQSVPTNDFINVNVDAVEKVRISPTPEGIRLAAKNFLNKKPADITMDLQDSLQGNMREIIGTISLKELCNDRKSFGDQVQEKAQVARTFMIKPMGPVWLMVSISMKATRIEMMAAAKGPKVKPPMQTTTSLKSKSKNMTLGISLDRSITM